MDIDRDDERFLKARQRLLQTWPMIGWSLLAALAGCTWWLLLTRPLLISPFDVMLRLREGALPASSIIQMAGLLPLVMLSCLVLAGVPILLMFASMAKERRYQRIIRELQGRGP